MVKPKEDEIIDRGAQKPAEVTELDRITQLHQLLFDKGILEEEYDDLHTALWQITLFEYHVKSKNPNANTCLNKAVETFGLFKVELEKRHENTDEIQKIVKDFDDTLLRIKTQYGPKGQ